MDFAMLSFLSQKPNIVIDKLDTTYTGRSTTFLENQVEQLPPTVKKALAQDELLLRAWYVHMYKNFDAVKIINSDLDD